LCCVKERWQPAGKTSSLGRDFGYRTQSPHGGDATKAITLANSSL